MQFIKNTFNLKLGNSMNKEVIVIGVEDFIGTYMLKRFKKEINFMIDVIKRLTCHC